MRTVGRNIALGAGGIVALAAVSPPMHSLVHQLFSIHMTQHLVLMVVAAALVAWGLPLPLNVSPLTIAAGNAVVLWAWHAPALYRAALTNDFLHVVEHASLFGMSWLLWDYVLNRPPYPQRIFVLFVTGLQCSALGAILAFASVVLYPIHDLGSFGLTALEDQQLAGSIMWVPAGSVYLGSIGLLLYNWFKQMDAGTARVEGS